MCHRRTMPILHKPRILIHIRRRSCTSAVRSVPTIPPTIRTITNDRGHPPRRLSNGIINKRKSIRSPLIMSVQVRSETQTDRRRFFSFSVDVALSFFVLCFLFLSLFESFLYLVLDFVYEKKSNQSENKNNNDLNTHTHTHTTDSICLRCYFRWTNSKLTRA